MNPIFDHEPAGSSVHRRRTGISVDEQLVDLAKGEHVQAAYTAINPSQLVPVLEDGDLLASLKARPF